MNGVLLRLALRNLRLHWVRTLIVGVLLALGAFLIVVGQATLDAIHDGMRRSVVQSLSGDLQVYSSDAKDKLELYQSLALAAPDLGQIDDFARLKEVVSAVPNVRAVVPMGVNHSVLTGGSTIENKLAELRRAVNEGAKERVGPLVAHVRQLCRGLVAELDKLSAVASDTKEVAVQRADLAKANGDAFWAEFEAQPLDALEFLENRVAPLALQSGFYIVSYVGTDLQAFAANFGLFEIVSGTMPPPGERGFLFNTTRYERFIKHRTARRLDELKEAIETEGRHIAGDVELARMVKRNVEQVTQITEQLDPTSEIPVRAALQAELKSAEPDVAKLLGAFLATDDSNFARRYQLFYEVIAPRIRLYAFGVGDTLTLYGQTKSGYPRAVNVKVWGVYKLKGLDKSMLAGAYNLMDLMTFRDLYGLSNAVSAVEIDALKIKSGIHQVDRAGAEDALFGDDAAVTVKGEGKAFDEAAGHDLVGLRRAAEAALRAPFTQAQLEAGPVPNAAIFVKDASNLPEAAKTIRAATDAAGLHAQVATWDEAQGKLVSGISVGITVVLMGGIVIVFLLALIVIVNALLMATSERLREIGTIRAIGAQRGFVVRMLAIEAIVMAGLFGGLGLLVGAGLVSAAGRAGIPATSDMQYFIYGGDKLYPALSGGHVLTALAVIGFVTVVASLIPALMAARIQPVTAMQAKE